MCSTVHNLLNMMAIIWRTNSTRNWFWNVSKKSMMSLQPNCSDNNFYTGIRCLLAKHQTSLSLRCCFFLHLLVSCWLALLDRKVWKKWWCNYSLAKENCFIFRSEESTTEKSGNKTCFSLQVIQSTLVFFWIIQVGNNFTTCLYKLLWIQWQHPSLAFSFLEALQVLRAMPEEKVPFES